MALFNEEVREEICKIVNDCDENYSNRLQLDLGDDENSITQKIAERITVKVFEYFLSIEEGIKIALYSQKNPIGLEQEAGTDAIVIIYDHDCLIGKVCLFEAKRDRKEWDKKIPGKNVSRFSSQLGRQKKYHDIGCLVWEQFYNGSGISSVRSSEYSTCILYEDAKQHNAPHPNDTVWTDKDMDQVTTYAKVNKRNFRMGELIKKACECTYGDQKTFDEILQILVDSPDIKDVLLIDRAPKDYRNRLIRVLTNSQYREYEALKESQLKASQARRKRKP